MNPPELPMNISCPIRVQLTGMVLNNNKGSFSLLGPGETVTGCIDLLQNQFTVTDDMYARWANFTNHTMDNAPGTQPYNSQTYAASKESLMGTLDVTLEGGFQTTIPHYELVNLDRGDGSDGSYTVLNDSRIESAVGAGETDYGIDFGVLLGGVFGAGIYMLIDYDRNLVSLAKANLNPGNPDIRPICSTNTSVPAPATSANSTSNNQNGLSKGDIDGIIIGCVGFIPAVIGVVYTALQYHRFMEHKRESRRRTEEEATEAPLPQTKSAETQATGNDEEKGEDE
jgi:hypothetical protein